MKTFKQLREAYHTIMVGKTPITIKVGSDSPEEKKDSGENLCTKCKGYGYIGKMNKPCKHCKGTSFEPITEVSDKTAKWNAFMARVKENEKHWDDYANAKPEDRPNTVIGQRTAKKKTYKKM